LGKLSIAIDGPAGAGKSTVAKIIAKRLNILYLDTGAMYRTVAYGVLQEGVSSEDREQVLRIIDSMNISVEYIDDRQRMLLDGIDVSEAIRSSAISKAASTIAVIPEVRLKLVEMQRNIAMRHCVVLDGRDIGTYVLPDADVKFFLEATLEERGRRRWKEMQAYGDNLTLRSITEDIRLRDLNDSSRDFAPLSKADDAIVIDTTDKTIEQVVEEMLKYIFMSQRNECMLDNG
jgi:cytidylate kinase